MSGVEARLPRAAATLVLLRDGDDGLETYLLRRATTMAFAPSMHVFPGGRVDPIDFERELRLVGMATDELAELSSCEAGLALALLSCAVRETFEEAGVVVYSEQDGVVEVDAREVVIFDHWVTPEREGKRYDVRFYAARLPQGQQAALTTTEAVHAAWLRPADAITAFEAGELAMLPPTEDVLRYFAAYGDVDAALRAARGRAFAPKLPRERDDRAWDLVHAYDGWVISEGIPAPHTREETGRP